jgi:hypothetical protein
LKLEGAKMRVIIALLLLVDPVAAQDLGRWNGQSPDVRKWVQNLIQPNCPFMSCRGNAGASWADTFEADDDPNSAIIKDDRPDPPLGRPHDDPGERIAVADEKWDQENPTGHGVIFIATGGRVCCYVPPGGGGQPDGI